MGTPTLSLLNEHIVAIDVRADFIYIAYDDDNGYADDWAILKKVSEKVTYWPTYNSMQVTNSDTVMFYCLLRSDITLVFRGYNAFS